MTFLHFINCAILTFAPPFIIYSATSLAEYGAWSIMLTASLLQLAATFTEMITVATFVETVQGAHFHIAQELMRASIGVVAIFAMKFALGYNFFTRKGGLPQEAKILACALGWVLAESVLNRLIPLWIGARQSEFQWTFLQTAVEANVHIVFYLAYVLTVWAWSRRDLTYSQRIHVYGLLALFVYYPVMIRYLKLVVGFGSWELVGVDIAVTAVAYLVASRVKSQYVLNRKSK